MIIKEVVAGIQGDNWDCYSNRRYFLAGSCSMLKPYLMVVVQLFKRVKRMELLEIGAYLARH